MQQQGLSVLLVEGKPAIGGGLRTAELTLPGFQHDICSAVHPLAVASPFLKTLPLRDYGLNFILPEVNAAHPFDDGSAAIVKRSIIETAAVLGTDESAYKSLVSQVVEDWPLLVPDTLGPLRFPKHPLAMARFGLKGLTPASYLAKRFKGDKAKGLLAGMAAHAIQPLTNLATSAVALVLLATGHCAGWPIPQGGSQAIASAMASYFTSLGGRIQTDFYVTSLKELPLAHAILFDVTPKQLLQIAGYQLSSLYKWQLRRFRYGMGVFKIDWALDAPIPFTAEACRLAGTLHLGSTFKQIAAGEQDIWNGKHPDKPFVLLSQPTVFDASRAPAGKHTGWAYCHVPNGSVKDMTAIIENQVERYAPGFKQTILARHTMNTEEIAAYNPNYIGGDINGGVLDLAQLFTRPVLRLSPYKTSAKGLYICSSSTPPGGGVHGMCGYYAAKKALRDVFNIKVTL